MCPALWSLYSASCICGLFSVPWVHRRVFANLDGYQPIVLYVLKEQSTVSRKGYGDRSVSLATKLHVFALFRPHSWNFLIIQPYSPPQLDSTNFCSRIASQYLLSIPQVDQVSQYAVSSLSTKDERNEHLFSRHLALCGGHRKCLNSIYDRSCV